MLSGISGEVKTTVAEAQAGLVALFPGYSASCGASCRGCDSAALCVPVQLLEAMDYPTVSTVASRPGRTKASVPTLTLGFAVAGRAKAPVSTRFLPGPPYIG